MRDSMQMHVAIAYSWNVLVSKLFITAPGWSPNTDGIHVSNSKQVSISECTISTGISRHLITQLFLNMFEKLVRAEIICQGQCIGKQCKEINLTNSLYFVIRQKCWLFFLVIAGDDCISIVTGSMFVRVTGIFCGPGHGIRYCQLKLYPRTEHCKNLKK